ncbi:hypothetical protein WMZ97_15610 [Lentibacillus sp. N15]|uniref:hypothetical protein n=1 Tax=Lentibacillus songyuanensis TaxID=3136161 RepID=UPI0031BA5005
MKNINYVKIKIIEEETPERAEYEINDFIEHLLSNIPSRKDVNKWAYLTRYLSFYVSQ